jgi:hypothetical protein
MLRTRGRPVVTGRDCVLAAGGFAATLAAVLAILQAQGVSIAKVYDSLVLLPARVFLTHHRWFVPPSLLKLTALWAMAGMAAALLTAWRRPAPGTPEWQVLFAGKSAFSVIAVATVLSGRPLLSIVTPFVWLALFDPRQAEDESAYLPRRLLAILTVLQTAYAFPVAGSQFKFVQILLWIVLAVCVGDSCFWLAATYPIPKRLLRWRGMAATAALAVVALAEGTIAVDRYRTYQSMPPLDLPGARLVHVNPGFKADVHWLVRNLKQQCDSFESLPGLPSLNFWTGIEPLTGLNIGAWMVSLPADDQRRVVAAIDGHARACMVYNQPLTAFWNRSGENLEAQPLAQYIFANFRAAGASGDYQLLLRNQRFAEKP